MERRKKKDESPAHNDSPLLQVKQAQFLLYVSQHSRYCERFGRHIYFYNEAHDVVARKDILADDTVRYLVS